MKTMFTIKKRDGTMWVATQVMLTMVEGDPDGAQEMSYVCSGVIHTVQLFDVEEVIWRMPAVTGAPAPEPKPEEGAAS